MSKEEEFREPDGDVKVLPLLEEPCVKWTEIPGIFILVGILGGFIAVAVIDLKAYTQTKCYESVFGDPRVTFFSPIILLIIVMSIILTIMSTIVFYFVAIKLPHHFIHISLILQVVVTLACVIIYLVQTSWLTGAICILWLVLSGILYWILRRNMNRITIQLTVVSQVLSANPSSFVISTFGAVFCGGWSVLVAAVTMAGFSRSISSECSPNGQARPEGEFLGLLSYIVITHYLLNEVVKGVIRVATCSLFGCWYYMPNEIYKAIEYPRLQGATGEGLFSALTYSLGSICLSSLFLAMSKLLAQVIGAWSQELMVTNVLSQTQDISVVLLAWMLSNCVWCLDSLLSHFTNYVLVHIALYNKSYIKGVKQSFNLIITEGVRAVVNDCLAGGTFMYVSWCIGTLSAICAYIYMRWIALYDIDGIFFITSYIVIVGVQISSIILVGIPSGLQTLFVATCNDPHILKETHPTIYEELINIH